MEELPAATNAITHADWNSIAVAVVGLIGAVTTLVMVNVYVKLQEVKQRVRDVQHKVGADHRDGD